MMNAHFYGVKMLGLYRCVMICVLFKLIINIIENVWIIPNFVNCCYSFTPMNYSVKMLHLCRCVTICVLFNLIINIIENVRIIQDFANC